MEKQTGTPTAHRYARRCIGIDEKVFLAAKQRARELGYRSFSAFVASMLASEVSDISVIVDDEAKNENPV